MICTHHTSFISWTEITFHSAAARFRPNCSWPPHKQLSQIFSMSSVGEKQPFFFNYVCKCPNTHTRTFIYSNCVRNMMINQRTDKINKSINKGVRAEPSFVYCARFKMKHWSAEQRRTLETLLTVISFCAFQCLFCFCFFCLHCTSPCTSARTGNVRNRFHPNWISPNKWNNHPFLFAKPISFS